MDKPIFQIPQKQYSGESAVVSMRLSKDMLADIDEAARVSGRTRNEIMTMGLEFALQHLVITGVNKPDRIAKVVETGTETRISALP